MTSELSTAQIRKLVRAHNVLVTIKIPPKATREQILKLIDSRGYQVNHKSKNKIVKTELQKQKAIEKKEEKEIEKKKKERELKKTAVKLATQKPAKKVVAKKVKVVSKEDEVRKPRAAAPPIPRAKDFVKIGGRPAGKKVEVGTLNKGSKN